MIGLPTDIWTRSLKQYSILDIRRNRDMKLWRRISSTALSNLLRPQLFCYSRCRRRHFCFLSLMQTTYQNAKNERFWCSA